MAIIKSRPKGRPSKFTKELASDICEALADGKSFRTICADKKKYPSAVTIYNWLATNEEFLKQYARAKERYADRVAEEIIEIADDSSEDEIFIEADEESGKSAKKVMNNEFVQRSRLRVDARKWIAARLAPKKYGDKMQQEVSGPDGGAIPVQFTVKFVGE